MDGCKAPPPSPATPLFHSSASYFSYFSSTSVGRSHQAQPPPNLPSMPDTDNDELADDTSLHVVPTSPLSRAAGETLLSGSDTIRRLEVRAKQLGIQRHSARRKHFPASFF